MKRLAETERGVEIDFVRLTSLPLRIQNEADRDRMIRIRHGERRERVPHLAIRRTLDWMIMDDGRNYMEFETPERADLFMARIPPEAREVTDGLGYCSRCGKTSERRPTSELTIIKHHMAGRPLGHFMTYCDDHLPEREWEEGSQSSGWKIRKRPVVEVEPPPCGLEFLHSRGLCGCGEEEWWLEDQNPLIDKLSIA
jgi:hypothetical protein